MLKKRTDRPPGKGIPELRGAITAPRQDGFSIGTKGRRTHPVLMRKKMEKLKLHTLDSGDKPDIFDGLFKDHSIDIRTGELLGRYIAEERDSARLLRSCYEQLCAAEGAEADATSESLTSLDAKVDALCRAVDELRQIVVAQAMPATRKARAAS